MFKLEDILVRTDDQWLPSGQTPLTVCFLEDFRIHWLRNFTNFYYTKGNRHMCKSHIFLLVQTVLMNIGDIT